MSPREAVARVSAALVPAMASVLLAPSKAYQTLADTLEPNGHALVMPTVELYRPAGQANRIGTFTLEMNR